MPCSVVAIFSMRLLGRQATLNECRLTHQETLKEFLFWQNFRLNKEKTQKRENPAFDENQLVVTKKGSPENGGGSWFHPKLSVPFARWLDVKFSIWCDMQIEKIV